MSNGRVSKGEQLLKALAGNKSCELTPEGAAYVTERFDPYHDKPMKPVGYPDSFNGHTVSRCVKKTITFTYRTGGLPAQTDPYDVCITMTPLAQQLEFNQTTIRQDNQFTCNAATSARPICPYGGLDVQVNPVSGSDFLFPLPISEAARNIGALALSEEDLSNSMRVISMGFEVIDGTAELYRQGILTVCRQNQPEDDRSEFRGWATTGDAANEQSIYDFTGQFIKFPPKNTSNALLYPDAKQWKVASGAYVDIDYNTDVIPMTLPSYVQPVLIPDAIAQLCDDNSTNFAFPYEARFIPVTIPTTVPQTNLNVCCPANRIYPINQTVVYLTGLNPLATITVNAIYYLECAPTSEDQELLSLASQSPALDNVALQIISKLRRDSPIAVKRNENYTGEWFFNGIRDVVSKVMPWLANAQVVGSQVKKWIDTAGTNDGMINPQTFVKGSVAQKIASEKNPPKMVAQKSKIPQPPRTPIKKKVAFKARSPLVNNVTGKPVRVKGRTYTDAELKFARKTRKKKVKQGYYNWENEFVPKGRALDAKIRLAQQHIAMAKKSQIQGRR